MEREPVKSDDLAVVAGVGDHQHENGEVRVALLLAESPRQLLNVREAGFGLEAHERAADTRNRIDRAPVASDR